MPIGTVAAVLRKAILIIAVIFAVPSAARAQEPAPPESHTGAGHATSVAALAMGGLLVGTAAVAVYYGPGAVLAGFLAAHWVVHAIVLGGAGAMYAFWPSDPEPAPAAPADDTAPPGGGTWL